MNKEDRKYNDRILFEKIAKHLVYLTTKDEYGTIRSRGIGTYDHLADELNNEGIVPDRGYWNENSIKLFFPRVMKRHPDGSYYENCDLDFIGRSAWEYLSYTTYEEVCDTPRRITKKTEYSYNKSRPSYSYNHSEIEKWKEHEIEDIIREDKNVIKKYKISKNRTRKSKS